MESLEEAGVWWPANDQEARGSGTLRFDIDAGAVLSLIETKEPADAVDAFRRRMEGKLGQYDVIHGANASGKRISLLNCFDRHTSGGVSGVETREVYANAVLHGFHAESSDPEIRQMVAVLRHVPAWLGWSGLSVAHPEGSVRVHHRQPDSLQLVENGELSVFIRLSLSLQCKTTSRGKAVALQEEAQVVVETAEPSRLSYFQDIASACRDLLSVACQRHCQTEKLSVVRVTGSEREKARFHAVPAIKAPAPKSEPIHTDLLFHSGQVKDVQDAFTRWIGQMERSRPVRGLYNSAVYGSNVLEGRFLAYTQAVEAQHRRFRGGAQMDPEKYQHEVLPILGDAIPDGLENSFRQSLKTRLKYGYDYSLRKRLQLLIAEHEMALRNVVPNAGDLRHEIVDLRNWLTHLPPEKGAEAEPEDYLKYFFLLRVLLELSFLADVGFSPEEIAELAEGCEGYRSWKQRLFDETPT